MFIDKIYDILKYNILPFFFKLRTTRKSSIKRFQVNFSFNIFMV